MDKGDGNLTASEAFNIHNTQSVMKRAREAVGLPKSIAKSPDPIENIAVLGADGACDGALEPDIDDRMLVRMYRIMLLARRLDERLLNLQRQGRLGTFAPVTGQEAAQVGAVATIGDEDWFAPSFRETAAALWRGMEPETIFLFTAGYNEGQYVPSGSRDLPTCVPVASQLPHAVGIAYASKLRDEPSVVMAFFGDGATSEGDFHEALNFAGAAGLPVVFVCQNNQWAISVPVDKQTGAETLAQKATAYGIQGVQVDGNDILAVYRAAQGAVERARKDRVPTLIECVTYRMSMHTTADDPGRYRSDEEVEPWRDRDPIDRFQTYLQSRQLLDDAEVKKLEEQIEQRIEDGWEAAQKRIADLTDPAVMFDHVFAEPTGPLRRQRANFEETRENAEPNRRDDKEPADG